VDVDLTPFEHACTLGHQIGRAGRAGNHLEDGARVIVAAKQWLRIEPARRIDDRRNLGVEDRASGKQDTDLPATDNLAVPDDHGPEGSAPALLDRFDRQPGCLFHEFTIHCERPCLRRAMLAGSTSPPYIVRTYLKIARRSRSAINVG